MKKRILLYLTLIVILVSSCYKNINDEQFDNIIHHKNSQKLAQVAKPTTVRMDKYNSTIYHSEKILYNSMIYYFIVASLILNLATIIFVVYLLFNKKHIRNYVINTTLSSDRVKDLIRDYSIHKDLSISRISNREIEDTVVSILNNNYENLKNKIISDLKKDDFSEIKETSNIKSTTSQNIGIDKRSRHIVLYATPADRNSNAFFNVTETPDENTIYTLVVNGNQAEFDIHEIAYKKVLNNPNKLECACEWQYIEDYTKFTVIEKGIAQKRVDGKWEITKKANIYFN